MTSEAGAANAAFDRAFCSRCIHRQRWAPAPAAGLTLFASQPAVSPSARIVEPRPRATSRFASPLALAAKAAAVVVIFSGAVLGLREAAGAFSLDDRAQKFAALSPIEIDTTPRSDLARKGDRLVAAVPPVVETASVTPASAASRPGVPQAICAAISMGAAPAEWGPSAMFDGEWECMDATHEAENGDEGAIFGMARGRDETSLDYVRLKLSLGRDALSDIRLFGEIAQTVVALSGREMPADIGEALQSLSPVQFSDGQVKYTFMPEKMNPTRYNLVIQFLRAPAVTGEG